MSNTPSIKLTHISVSTPFPAQHIQAFGLATVGRVYIFKDADGRIVKAAAKLSSSAPYNRMIIDDPHILQIFGDCGETVDMSVLDPAPKFRLDPVAAIPDDDEDLEMNIFDVGRLVDITHLPSTARFGTEQHNLGMAREPEGGAVHQSVRKTFENEWAKKLSKGVKAPATSTAPKKTTVPLPSLSKAKRRTQKSKAVPPLINYDREHDSALPKVHSTETTRVLSPISEQTESEQISATPVDTHATTNLTPAIHHDTPMPAMSKGPFGTRMGDVLEEIRDKLPRDTHATYYYFISDGRYKNATKTTQKNRMHNDLEAFVRRHDIVELHNRYAKLGISSGWNKPYRIPLFEEGEDAES